MAGQLTPIVQRDFSGGLNLAANPYLIPKKQVWRVRNMILDEHGALRTRPGSSTLFSSSGISAPITYVRQLKRSSGTTHDWAIVRDGATNRLYHNLSTPPYTLLHTFSTDYRIPQAVTVLDYDVIAPGYETPVLYDGTTVTSITCQPGQTLPPGAKHCAYHLGNLWLWNTNPTTTTLDGPSSLRSSRAIGGSGTVVSDWPDSFQTFIGKDDGSVGMGLCSYTIVETGISPISTLVAFKNFSAYQISGVFGATVPLQVQQIKTDMGCIAPRSIQFVSGFGIIRLTHKGFALYNGVDDKLISEEIRPAIFGNEQTDGDILSIDFDNVEISAAGQVQNPPLYVCACPVKGSATLTRYFVFDLVRKAWTICDFPYQISWIGPYYQKTTADLIAGSQTDGTIYRLMGLTDTTDNGSAISWEFRTGPITSGNPTGLMFWRRVLLDLVYPPLTGVDYAVHLTGIVGTLSGSRTPNPLVTAGRTDISIMRYAPSVYLQLSGSGNVRVRAITWQGKVKPLTRAVI